MLKTKAQRPKTKVQSPKCKVQSAEEIGAEGIGAEGISAEEIRDGVKGERYKAQGTREK